MKVTDASSRGKVEKTKKLLFETLKNKTTYYLNKPTLEDTDLYYYVKDFFREYLDISTEISFDEIMREIDKTYIRSNVKESISEYLKKIREVEYKDTNFSEEQIKKYVSEFYDIAIALRYEDKKEKTSLMKRFAKMLGLGKKKKKVEVRETTNIAEQTPQTQTENQTPQTQAQTENQTPQTQTQTENQTPQTQAQIQNKNEPPQSQAPSFEEAQTQNEQAPRFENNYSEETKQEKQKKTQEKIRNVPISDDFTEDVNLNQNQQESAWQEETAVEKNTIEELIAKAKNANNREELIKLYREINNIYEQEPMEKRAKIYPELLEIYKKITKK